MISLNIDSLKQTGDLIIKISKGGVSLKFPNGRIIKAEFDKKSKIRFDLDPLGLITFYRTWTASKINDQLYRIRVKRS